MRLSVSLSKTPEPMLMAPSVYAAAATVMLNARRLLVRSNESLTPAYSEIVDTDSMSRSGNSAAFATPVCQVFRGP